MAESPSFPHFRLEMVLSMLSTHGSHYLIQKVKMAGESRLFSHRFKTAFSLVHLLYKKEVLDAAPVGEF